MARVRLADYQPVVQLVVRPPAEFPPQVDQPRAGVL